MAPGGFRTRLVAEEEPPPMIDDVWRIVRG